MRMFWTILVASVATATVQAVEPVAWRIVSVHDGDTVTAVDPGSTQHLIRVEWPKDIAVTCPHYVAKSLKALA
jgi:hypothetical protein